MIAGVVVKKLKHISDERGFLMEMLRNDDPFFQKFGQVYITVCNPGYVKAWHHHEKQSDNFVVIKGEGRVGLYDGRSDSSTKGQVMDLNIGESNPTLVFIPVGVMHGFEAVGDKPCYLVNCVTEPYNYKNPDEKRIDPFNNDIPFQWNSKKGG